MTDPRPATRRLFVAVWPDDAARAALQAWRDACGWPPAARPTPAAQWHLTLHFLGDVAVDRLPALGDALAVDASPVTVSFAKPAVWHGGIAVLEPVAVPRELVDLHARLADALRSVGLVPEARPWRPHLTLGRQAAGLRLPADDGAAPPPVTWRADGWRLVDSAGGRYTALRDYPARGGVPPGATD